MKTNFRMLEATNKKEAITSILDVIAQNPLWLNKCTSPLYCVVKSLTTNRRRKAWLNLCQWEQVRDLFVEIKTEYYANRTELALDECYEFKVEKKGSYWYDIFKDPIAHNKMVKEKLKEYKAYYDQNKNKSILINLK